MKQRVVVALAALMLLVGACSATRSESDAGFPAFVYVSASSLEGYRVAKRIPETLEGIPCYCGCAKTNQHRSLKDCFVRPDGGWDNHASGCDVCVKEALDVDRWQKEGRSLAEIRRLIDDRYKDYGQPTDTPPVE